MFTSPQTFVYIPVQIPRNNPIVRTRNNGMFRPKHVNNQILQLRSLLVCPPPSSLSYYYKLSFYIGNNIYSEQ